METTQMFSDRIKGARQTLFIFQDLCKCKITKKQLSLIIDFMLKLDKCKIDKVLSGELKFVISPKNEISLTTEQEFYERFNKGK